MATRYYWGIRLVPKNVRDDVFKLYSFVHYVDDLTLSKRDAPPDLAHFEKLEHRWRTAKRQLTQKLVPPALDESAGEQVLANMAYLVHRHRFDTAWVDAFLQSRRWDVQKHHYRALKDLQEYLYGSAEVVGLMLARIVGVPEDFQKAVRVQARALQYMDCLRTIPAADAVGRCYFPLNDIKKFGLKNLSEQEVRTKPGMFTDFIHAELLRYAQWQAEAHEVLTHLPRRLRAPLQTVVDTQTKMAQKIKNNPLVIYDQDLHVSRRSIVFGTVRHGFRR